MYVSVFCSIDSSTSIREAHVMNIFELIYQKYNGSKIKSNLCSQLNIIKNTVTKFESI